MLSDVVIRMKYTPTALQRPVRPPFHVPAEDLTAWDNEDEVDYQYWRGQTDHTRKDYREFLLSANKEYDMEDAFDKVEAGLNALEVIIGFKKNFPNYKTN